MVSENNRNIKNRYLNATLKEEIKKLKKKSEKMTYILGACCEDGVVLIADRKVTNSTFEEYTDKIKPLSVFPSIIFTAAGTQALFEEFLGELPRRALITRNYLVEQNRERPESTHYSYDSYNFKQDCVTLLNDMHDTYSRTSIPDDATALQVLFVIKEIHQGQVRSRLYYVDWGDRYPLPVLDKWAIGQSELASIFLKSYSPDIKMKDAARLGAFIIKYIEKEHLSPNDGVGVGESLPQIWLCPNQGEPSPLTNAQITELISDIDAKIGEVISKYGSGSRFLRL